MRFATDISNLLFAIYFRLIKNPTGGIIEAAIITNRLLLRPVLTGLAKFGHLMSIDYFQVSSTTKKKFSCLFTFYFRVLMMLFVYTFLFQDLLRVLSDLLDRKLEDGYRYFLGNHESLLCIHTVLSILSGQVILIPICLYFIYVQKKNREITFHKKNAMSWKVISRKISNQSAICLLSYLLFRVNN